jgi:quinoprotein glucose dehydrogenase
MKRSLLVPIWAVSGALLITFLVVSGLSAPQANQAPRQSAPAGASWAEYGGGPENSQYSPLNQINKTNVQNLEQAWFYPTGTPHAFNPVVVDGVMYVLGKQNTLVALDATTGKEVWTHAMDGPAADRGINYWESKDRSDRRLLFTVDNYLQEVNAKTGVTINTFGNDGKVDLKEGLGRDPKTIARIQSGTPGHVFENLIILGSATGEGFGSPPGDLRAYDVLTGKEVWQFHTIPHPGEFGYDTWPKDAWKYEGGVNTWGELAIDTKRGIAYFPTGSPTYDFYGADRWGTNLFSDCLIALDARTGKRLWHFQFVHHDLWDYDAVAAPKLLTVRHNGQMVDAVAQATKQGFLYAFNRVTGEPLWPIDERQVPKSDVPGEQSWPTQPYPTKPPAFARQKFTVADLNPYNDDPADVAHWKQIFAEARNEGVYTPPAVGKYTVEIPGNNGGANWGGTAADPERMMYVISKDAPCLLILSERPQSFGGQNAPTIERQGADVYSQQCESCHGSEREGHIGPALQTVIKDRGATATRNVIVNGKGEMPPFKSLSADDVDSLIAFLTNPQLGSGPAPAAGRGGPGGGGQAQGGQAGGGRGRGRGPAPVAARLPFPPGLTRYSTPYGTMTATNGLPAIAPPWSQITAYDLNEGTIKWQIPLGNVPALAAKGITDTGSYWPRGGPMSTAGGLLFANSCGDLTVHAYDKDTGKQLWSKEVGACPQGIPSSFEVGGRQYIAISTAQRANDNNPANPNTLAVKQPSPAGYGYYVFALKK